MSLVRTRSPVQSWWWAPTWFPEGQGDEPDDHHARVQRVQGAELHHHEEQADHDRQAGQAEVLPAVPQAHRPQGDEVELATRAGANAEARVEASSSNGRAAVSKTACWGFESLLACQLLFLEERR